MKKTFKISGLLCCMFAISVFASGAYAYDAGDELNCETESFGGSDTEATFQAEWTPHTWTVQYNKGDNNATGTLPSSHSCTYGQSCTAGSGSGLTNGTSVFSGWLTSCVANGGGACDDFNSSTVSSGADITNITSSNGATVTLTAQWGACTPCNPGANATCTLTIENNQCVYTTSCPCGYTISGNGTATPSCTAKTISLNWTNGGHGTIPVGAPSTCTYGSTFVIPGNMTATGYSFGGWSQDGTNTITADCTSANLGAGVCTSNAATISGLWSAKTVQITYTNDMGTAPSGTSCLYGESTFTLPDAPTAPTGYSFAGWTLVQ